MSGTVHTSQVLCKTSHLQIRSVRSVDDIVHFREIMKRWRWERERGRDQRAGPDASDAAVAGHLMLGILRLLLRQAGLLSPTWRSGLQSFVKLYWYFQKLSSSFHFIIFSFHFISFHWMFGYSFCHVAHLPSNLNVCVEAGDLETKADEAGSPWVRTVCVGYDVVSMILSPVWRRGSLNSSGNCFHGFRCFQTIENHALICSHPQCCTPKSQKRMGG